MAETPKFEEKYKPTLSGNTKRKKCEEIYTETRLKTCDKEKILKSAKGKKEHLLYRRTKIRTTVYFLSEMMQTNKKTMQRYL